MWFLNTKQKIIKIDFIDLCCSSILKNIFRGETFAIFFCKVLLVSEEIVKVRGLFINDVTDYTLFVFPKNAFRGHQ